MMSLIELRNILIAERQSGQLTDIPRNLSEEAQTALKEHRGKIFSASDPMSDENQMAIEEADGIDELIETIYSMRLNKITTLALTSGTQSHYEEFKRMTPQERAVFDDIFARVNTYRTHLKIQKSSIPTEKKPEPVTPIVTPISPPPVITSPISHVQAPPLPPQSAPTPKPPQAPFTFGAGIEGGIPHDAVSPHTVPKPQAPTPKPPLPIPRPPLQKLPVSPEPVKKETPAQPQAQPAKPTPQPTPQIPPKPKEPEPLKPSTGKPPDKLVIIPTQDIEMFVGIDGRSYTLKKGAFEIVPRANAETLIAQGIAKMSGTVTKKA
jgi:DNA replication initiation complex subunit (GINS family)